MLLPSYLVVFVGSCQVRFGSHMSRLRHLGWNQCFHGLSSRPLESCHHQCLKAVCGVMRYPCGAAAELLDGTLKLRYCTTIFTTRFPPWSLPRVGNGVVNGSLVLLVIILIQVVIGVKGSGLPGRHVQVNLLMSFRILGIQRRGDGKDCAPLPPKEWRVRSASLAIFFLDLGLGEVLHQATPGTCFRRQQAWGFFRLDSTAEGSGALAQVRLISCTHVGAHGQTCVSFTLSAPQPPQPPQPPQGVSVHKCCLMFRVTYSEDPSGRHG